MIIRRVTLAVPLLATLCLAQNGIFDSPARLSTVHLSFTREQWKGIEPKGGNHGMSFGRGEWLQGPPGKRNGLASAMGFDFPSVHAALTVNDREFPDVSVRYKGNGTFLEGQGARKFSFKIDLNQFAKDQRLDGVTKLNLHSNVTDPSWMNEPLSYRLYRDAGVPAPRTSYARVYVTVAGEKRYAGLYSIVENLDDRFVARAMAHKGGVLFKPVSVNLFQYLGDDWAKYNQTYDPKNDLTAAQKQRLIDFTRLLSRDSEEDLAAHLGDFLDLDEFARYMAVMVFLSDMDGILGPGQNFYLYLDPVTRKFSFLPWDQDHSFGQFPMGSSQQQRNELSILKPWAGRKPFLERIFAVPAFRKLYLARLEEFSKTIFKPERFTAQVDELAPVLRPAVQEESKLDRFDRAVTGASRSIVPIKPFVQVRHKSIVDQLAGRSTGERIDDRR